MVELIVWFLNQLCWWVGAVVLASAGLAFVVVFAEGCWTGIRSVHSRLDDRREALRPEARKQAVRIGLLEQALLALMRDPQMQAPVTRELVRRAEVVKGPFG